MFERAVQKQHTLHDHSKAAKLKNQLARLEKLTLRCSESGQVLSLKANSVPGT